MKWMDKNVITYQESMYFSHDLRKKYTRNMNSLCISFCLDSTTDPFDINLFIKINDKILKFKNAHMISSGI